MRPYTISPTDCGSRGKNMKRDCSKCKECQVVYANGGWSFLGCYHLPYHGMWCCEIKDCPKEAMEGK